MNNSSTEALPATFAAYLGYAYAHDVRETMKSSRACMFGYRPISGDRVHYQFRSRRRRRWRH